MKPGKDYIGIGGGILIFSAKGGSLPDSASQRQAGASGGNKKVEILLMKRGKKSKNEAGWWCKPGGAVDYGETAIKAMEREIKEETGLRVKIWGLLPHTDQILRKEKQHWVAINFLADLKSGEPKIMEPEKCEEIRWFNIKKLPKKLTKTTREPVKNYLKGKYIIL